MKNILHEQYDEIQKENYELIKKIESLQAESKRSKAEHKELFEALITRNDEIDRENERLKDTIKNYEHNRKLLQSEKQELEQQNESYQEALIKIAEYPRITTTFTEKYSNAVSIAKKALKGVNHE